MNQPFNNDQPVQPTQTSAQMQTPGASMAPANSSPFESPTQPVSPAQPSSVPPANMGGMPTQGVDNSGMAPMSSPKSSWGLIIALVVILFLGVLVFASWEGWISLGGIEKLWKKSATTTTTTTPTATDTTNANDKQRKTDLADLKAALAKYYQAQQAYPVALTTQKTSDTTNVLSALVPTYIAKLPIDPLTPTYYYGYKSDGKTFEITAVLEDKTTTGGTQVGTLYLYKVTDASVETPVATSATDTTTDTTATAPSTTTTTTTTPSTTTSGTASGTSSATSTVTQ